MTGRPPSLTIGSLFSGIGGLELGLEWAGLGPVIWQVEKEAFCRGVLAKNYPEAKRFDDVCTVGAAQLARVDLICGGFPCQDVSSAGRREGLAGSRSGLWREFARILRELRPAWVVVENVASGAAAWLDAVVGELEELGYECLPIPLSASDVGAPHRRARIFVVAHAGGSWELQPSGGIAELGRRAADGTVADPDGHCVRLEQGRRQAGACATEFGHDGATRDVADDDGVRGDARQSDEGTERSGRAVASRGVAPDALPSRRKGSGPGAHTFRQRPASSDGWWASESGMVPLVHGLSGGLAGRRRRSRIRALGNSVVPQCAEVVGWVIRELAGLTPESAVVA